MSFVSPINLVAIAIKARCTPIVWGPPGVGKTALMPALALALDYLPPGDKGGVHNRTGFASVSGAFLANEDYMGLPIPKGDGIVRGIDAHFQAACDTATLFLIDEGNRTNDASAMNGMMRFINERMCGAKRLHKDTAIVVTANAVTSSGARELHEALANRVVHIEWQYDHKAYIDYLLGGTGIASAISPMPDDDAIAAQRNDAAAIVAGFLQAKPDHGHKEPGPDVITDKPWGRAACGPWPAPRSWDMVVRILSVVSAMGDIRKAPYADALHLLISGCVGSGVAGEFYRFLTASDLRTGAEVLDDPAYAPRPGRIDLLWAEYIGASIEANRRCTTAAFHRMADLYEKLPGNPEVVTICAPYLLGTMTGATPEQVRARTVFGPELAKRRIVLDAIRNSAQLTGIFGAAS